MPIASEYYAHYIGPHLVKATWNSWDVLERVLSFYGTQRNWDGLLYTYEEVFGFDTKTGDEYYLEFEGSEGLIHWSRGLVGEGIYMNPSSLMPTNQDKLYWHFMNKIMQPTDWDHYGQNIEYWSTLWKDYSENTEYWSQQIPWIGGPKTAQD